MLRRRVVGASIVAASATVRHVTSKGQFNPIHDFSVSLGKYDAASEQGRREKSTTPTLRFARNEKEFETIITNPGPMRVGYSPDYLNWLYLAYKNKVAYELEKQQHDARKGKKGSVGGAADAAPGAVDLTMGRFIRPESSIRRRAGEAKKAANQAKLSHFMRQQGYYDLIERQPQFPFVDLANATRFHYVELFKDLVLNYYNGNYFNMSTAGGGEDGNAAGTAAGGAGEFSFAQELWDKALMYRAILEERKNAYPEKTFKTVFEAVKDTNLVPFAVATAGGGGGGGASANANAEASSSSSALADRCPTEEQYLYQRYLVKKYFVENAVEAHVVLKAHRQPNAAELLFSSPPPKDDNEVFASLAGMKTPGTKRVEDKRGGGEAPAGGAGTADAAAGGVSRDSMRRTVAMKPGRYPPIEALWRCEENLPLLQILVFGELNLFVSENPFVKFPNALAFLTRPYASSAATSLDASVGAGGSRYHHHHSNRGDNRRQGDVLSLANIIAERRGSALASIPRNVANLIDSRSTDIRRQQQRFHREDILAFSKVLGQHTAAGGGAAGASGSAGKHGSASAGGEDDAFFYGAFSDFAYYNPRTTRAEKRDYLSRKSLAALKVVRAAEEDVYRASGVEEAEANQQFSRVVDGVTTLPATLPTVAHYVALVKADPHVSFLLHAGVDGRAGELNTRIVQLARALASTALHFHQQAVRRVNRQKANVAAALLDDLVEQELARAKVAAARAPSSSSSPSSSSLPAVEDDQLRMINGLGTFMRFENRPLDASGYFTDARVDDYKRWMAAP